MKSKIRTFTLHRERRATEYVYMNRRLNLVFCRGGLRDALADMKSPLYRCLSKTRQAKKLRVFVSGTRKIGWRYISSRTASGTWVTGAGIILKTTIGQNYLFNTLSDDFEGYRRLWLRAIEVKS